jgi:hypothetical protein
MLTVERYFPTEFVLEMTASRADKTPRREIVNGCEVIHLDWLRKDRRVSKAAPIHKLERSP